MLSPQQRLQQGAAASRAGAVSSGWSRRLRSRFSTTS